MNGRTILFKFLIPSCHWSEAIRTALSLYPFYCYPIPKAYVFSNMHMPPPIISSVKMLISWLTDFMIFHTMSLSWWNRFLFIIMIIITTTSSTLRLYFIWTPAHGLYSSDTLVLVKYATWFGYSLACWQGETADVRLIIGVAGACLEVDEGRKEGASCSTST